MEEIEDDLAAEEENKLINEVRRCPTSHPRKLNNTQEYKTWYTVPLLDFRILIVRGGFTGKRMPRISMI